MCKSNEDKPKRDRTNNWQFKSAVNWIAACRDKYGNKFDYRKVEFKGVSKKVVITCPFHGDQKVTPAQHLRNAAGCGKCGQELAAIKSKQLERELIAEKHCSRCDQTLPINKFPSYTRNKVKKSGSTYTYKAYSAYCGECKKQVDRDRMRKMLSTKEGKEKNKARCKEYQKSNKYQKRIKERRINKLNSALKTSIKFTECEDCGDIICINLSAKRIVRHKGKCSECRRVAYYKDNYNGYTDKAKEAHRKRYIQKCIDNGPDKCKCCSKAYFRFEDGANHSTCSDQCRVKLKKFRKKSRKRLRNKRSNAFRSNYNSLMVFKRDKWKCQFCGCKVQKKDIYANNAAEVDHIVPISDGGVDEYWNVHTSCRKCNQDKSNNAAGQLSIFHGVAMVG